MEGQVSVCAGKPVHWIVTAAALVTALSAGCSSDSGPPENPLDQMSISFAGSPSRQSIKTALDPVLRAYGLTIDDDGYSKAGSVLVALNKELGVGEMDIVACMSQGRDIWAGSGFDGGAGYAAFTISRTGRCDPTAAGTNTTLAG